MSELEQKVSILITKMRIVNPSLKSVVQNFKSLPFINFSESRIIDTINFDDEIRYLEQIQVSSLDEIQQIVYIETIDKSLLCLENLSNTINNCFIALPLLISLYNKFKHNKKNQEDLLKEIATQLLELTCYYNILNKTIRNLEEIS